MKAAARYKAGDRVEVVLDDWYPAQVIAVGWWTDVSGNTWPVYTVRFDGTGGEIRCGHNSMRTPHKGAR